MNREELKGIEKKLQDEVAAYQHRRFLGITEHLKSRMAAPPRPGREDRERTPIVVVRKRSRRGR